MIIKTVSEYSKELTDFLYDYNKLKEYFIAWIPEDYEKISALDKSSFILCVEEAR